MAGDVGRRAGDTVNGRCCPDWDGAGFWKGTKTLALSPWQHIRTAQFGFVRRLEAWLH